SPSAADRWRARASSRRGGSTAAPTGSSGGATGSAGKAPGPAGRARRADGRSRRCDRALEIASCPPEPAPDGVVDSVPEDPDVRRERHLADEFEVEMGVEVHELTVLTAGDLPEPGQAGAHR